jgi:hypothetical protein
LDNFTRKFKYSKIWFSRSRNSNSRFSFWWIWWRSSFLQDATEEYNGATWTSVNPMFKYSKRLIEEVQQVLKQQL